jgi:hypothetical protein
MITASGPSPPASPPGSASASTPNPVSNPKEFWERFLGSSISFTPYELSLYSRLELDSFALEIAKCLCSRLSIPSLAGKTLAEALEKSLSIDDPHRNLTYLQKITGKLSATESGLNVLSIVGVVCEYYTGEAVVPVFNRLARFLRLPVDLMPSTEKWRSLSQLSNTSSKIDDFTRLVDRLTQLGQAEGMQTSGFQHIGGEDVAGVLYGMGELRRGDRKSRTACMGKDAGWVAAVAEWLFDLKIVLKGQDARVLYTNCDAKNVQFDVRFQKPGVHVDGLPVLYDPLTVKGRA